jgi:hypothetical protein
MTFAALRILCVFFAFTLRSLRYILSPRASLYISRHSSLPLCLYFFDAKTRRESLSVGKFKRKERREHQDRNRNFIQTVPDHHIVIGYL